MVIMFIVIENVNREQNCKVFHNNENAERYVTNQITKRIREDINQISYKDGIITYNDGTEVWYNVVESEAEDE